MHPPVRDTQDFKSLVAGIELRRDYRRPYAFAIGAVRFDEKQDVQNICFPHINVGQNYGSAAIFADVTHHRNGNAAREVDFWDMRVITELFHPFLEENGHSNVDAFIKVRFLVFEQKMQGFVVFVEDLDDNNCQGHSGVYASFMKQLALQSVGIRQAQQIPA